MLRYYREIPVIADTGSVSDEFRLPGINADCVRSILVRDGGLRFRIQRPPPPTHPPRPSEEPVPKIRLWPACTTASAPSGNRATR